MVFLLWLNEAVLGVFDTFERAHAEAVAIMDQYGGPWQEQTSRRWTDLQRWVVIEPRKVH
jgi:hypothetical protein